MSDELKNPLHDLVRAITDSYESEKTIAPHVTGTSPSREAVIDIIGKLRALVFPGYVGHGFTQESADYYVGGLLTEIYDPLRAQIALALNHDGGPTDCAECEEIQNRARKICLAFFSRISTLRELFATDVQAAFDGDPAASGLDEIIFCYPGVFAVGVQRLAHELFVLGVPLIPRIMTEYAHNITGIDIHPGAQIGRSFFIDHGTGVVIGETTVIGENVKLYQGVTLGALSTRGGQSLRGVKRHPTLENNVTVYSGASILGGDTVIGEGVVVGSNAFITKTVPGGMKVTVKNPELLYRGAKIEQPSAPEEWTDWVI